MSETKICISCQEEKSIDDFYLTSNNKFHSYCKRCNHLISTRSHIYNLSSDEQFDYIIYNYQREIYSVLDLAILFNCSSNAIINYITNIDPDIYHRKKMFCKICQTSKDKDEFKTASVCKRCDMLRTLKKRHNLNSKMEDNFEYIVTRYQSETFNVLDLSVLFERPQDEVVNYLKSIDPGLYNRTKRLCKECYQFKDVNEFRFTNNKKTARKPYCKRCNVLQRVRAKLGKLSSEEKGRYIIAKYQTKTYTTFELSIILETTKNNIINYLRNISEDLYNHQIFWCIKCGNLTPFNYIDSSDFNDNYLRCLDCRHSKSKSWHYENKDHANAKARNWYKENKDRHHSNCHNWWHQNKNNFVKINLKIASEIAKYDEIKESDDGYLMIKCTNSNCQKWFNPTVSQVYYRLNAIKGFISIGTQNNFYCSEECKNECPLFKQLTTSFDDSGQIKPKYNANRIDQPDLRKLVLERDGNVCQICSSEYDESQLICHHIEPVVCNPVESADVDNCIMLCPICDEHVHSLPGCTLSELSQQFI